MFHFYSDPHWNHAKIINYSNRPFDNVIEMNTYLTNNWNNHVAPDDTTILLGDIVWAKHPQELDRLLSSLNGKKILCFGNHDKAFVKNPDIVRKHFLSAHAYLELEVEHQLIMCFHYPMLEWNKCHRGAWHIHGHVHGNRAHPKHCKMLDVGADPLAKMRGGAKTDYYPINFNDLKRYMDKQPLLAHY
jgi:calcineurin-like phosphoesterase family protein